MTILYLIFTIFGLILGFYTHNTNINMMNEIHLYAIKILNYSLIPFLLVTLPLSIAQRQESLIDRGLSIIKSLFVNVILSLLLGFITIFIFIYWFDFSLAIKQLNLEQSFNYNFYYKDFLNAVFILDLDTFFSESFFVSVLLLISFIFTWSYQKEKYFINTLESTLEHLSNIILRIHKAFIKLFSLFFAFFATYNLWYIKTLIAENYDFSFIYFFLGLALILTLIIFPSFFAIKAKNLSFFLIFFKKLYIILGTLLTGNTIVTYSLSLNENIESEYTGLLFKTFNIFISKIGSILLVSLTTILIHLSFLGEFVSINDIFIILVLSIFFNYLLFMMTSFKRIELIIFLLIQFYANFMQNNISIYFITIMPFIPIIASIATVIDSQMFLLIQHYMLLKEYSHDRS